MAYVTVNPSTNIEFKGVIFHPCYPTEELKLEIQADFPDTPIAETLDFEMMGEDNANYNRLGWAVQQYGGFATRKMRHLARECYNNMHKLAELLDLFGYVRTYEASHSVIDVWARFPCDEDNKDHRLTHFSLLTEYGWTSKLGKCELIRHGRYDLEVFYNGDDEDHAQSITAGSLLTSDPRQMLSTRMTWTKNDDFFQEG